MPKHDISKLNQIYSDSEACDRELFAEQRSNILLCSSEHYKKVSQKLWGRVKDDPRADEHKLRLTQNHTAVITSIYRNQIVSGSPSVKILPANQGEQADQKAAELNDAVVQDAKRRFKIREKIKDWAQDFVEIGEVAVRIYWDERAGRLIGYKQATNEEGHPLYRDPHGNTTAHPSTYDIDPLTGERIGEIAHEPISSEEAVFEGDFKFERIMGFNLMRDKNAQSMEESPYYIVRRMVDIEEAKLMVGDDKDKLKFIQESSETTFKVFDAHSGNYQDSKGQILFKEYYWKPCPMYPNGYFYITTGEGILFEGELPFGVFPIIYRGFDKIQTSPRARSIIKRLRPYQAEINRAASEIATAQLALTPKLLIQHGTKLSKGSELPGVRVMQYTGAVPTVMPGYSGEGYLGYLTSRIDEMYRVANVSEIAQESQANAQLDAYSLLYRSAKNKQRFALYVEAFEDFLVEVFETFLKLARHYYDDSRVIRAAGRREAINVQEFRQTDPLDYTIRVEPMSDDIESTLGQQLQLNHMIQYLGPSLPPDAIGRVIKAAPFLNKDQILDSFTIDDDCINSDILQLDRGQYVPANKYDNHQLYIKRLIHRVKQSDFRFLPVDVQNLYHHKIQEHEQVEAQVQAELQAAQAGFIPTGGGFAKVDVYEPDPQHPGSQRRMIIPVEAVLWLKARLDQQGSTQDALNQMNQAAVADMAQMVSASQPQAQQYDKASMGTDLPMSQMAT